MATSTHLPIFIFFFFISSLVLVSTYAQSSSKPEAFSFPIKKDENTSQYYTTIQVGSNSTKLNVVIDLGGRFLWLYSLRYLRAAASFRPMLCDTPQCKLVEGPGCTNCSTMPPGPGCYNNSCSDVALNPFSGTVVFNGLGLDVLTLYSTRRRQHKMKNFAFQYTYWDIRKGLASPADGVIGLGRTGVSLQAQVASAFNISQKLALCIPPSGNEGNFIIGEAAYTKPFPVTSKSLFTTPLIRNPVSTWGSGDIGNFSVEYFINVVSINVGGTTLALNKTLFSINKKTGGGGTGLRTVRGYTNLHRTIYTALINEFVKAAASKNITRVASVAPFGACFDSKTLNYLKTGPDVPTIDLVLKSKNVYWRFDGSCWKRCNVPCVCGRTHESIRINNFDSSWRVSDGELFARI